MENEFKSYREIAEFLQPIYQSNLWVWGYGVLAHIPTVDELEEQISELVRDVGPEDGDTLGTGRIFVIRSELGREINLTLSIPELEFDG